MSWQEVTSVVAAMIVFAGTYIGVRSTRETAGDSNRTEEWHRLLTEHKSWQDVQQARIERLETRLDEMEHRFSALESKYRIAVAYIRRIVGQMRRHVPPEQIEVVPEEIRPDV